MKYSIINPDEDVHIEKGGAYKEIVNSDGKARREIYKRYYVFLIPVNTSVSFRIKVLFALNLKATEKNVYWVAQASNKFKSHKWSGWKSGDKEKTLAVYMTDLNKLSEEFKDVSYSEKSTKGIGKKYVFAKLSKNEKYFGAINFASSKLGKGIWVEGINYFPSWKSQGAFVIAVDKPQIMSFYAKKRISTSDPNSQEKNLEFIAKDIQNLMDELEYGAIVDLHIKLHNVPFYDIELTITIEGENVLEKNIALERDLNNPILDYNIEQRYELYISPSWITDLKHKEGSIKQGTISIVLVPNRAIRRAPHTEEYVKKLKKEIHFSINYKDEWNTDQDEEEWIAQIAEIKEATLVTQKHEECLYTALEVKIDGEEDVIILKESGNKEGSLEINDTTPIIEIIAGNKGNKKTITILAKNLDTTECVNEMGFSNTDTKSGAHTGYVFNTNELDYLNDTISGATDKNIFKVAPNLTYKVDEDAGTLTIDAMYGYDTSHKLKGLKYLPGVGYDTLISSLPDIHTFLIPIQTCRYIRTPLFKIYPDDLWTFHLIYNGLGGSYFFQEDDSYDDKLLKGADKLLKRFSEHLDEYIIELSNVSESEGLVMIDKKDEDTIFNKMISWAKTSIGGEEEDTLLIAGTKWIKDKLIEFLKAEAEKNAIGFLLQYDNKNEEINYTEEYQEVFEGMILAMMTVSFILEILLMFFSGGSTAIFKAKKALKATKVAFTKQNFNPATFNKIKEKYKELGKAYDDIGLNKEVDLNYFEWEDVKGDKAKGFSSYSMSKRKKIDINIDIILPKTGVNYGTYYEKQPDGKVNRIHEFSIKANPFLAVNIDAAMNTDQIIKVIKNVNRWMQGLEPKTYDIKKGKTIDASLKFGFVAIGAIVSELKVKFNSNTKTFIIKDHENQKEEKKTDDKVVIKNGARIIVDLYGKGEMKAQVKWVPFLKASVSAKVNVGGHVGVNNIYGYDSKGPYMHQEFYFSGLKGTFTAKMIIGKKNVFSFNSDNQKIKNGEISDKTKKELEENAIEPYVMQTPKFYPLDLINN
ncbi:MAG: hypothetical protein JKY08_10380 [Flavobacteriaceae bacterium]|nr:hypothetical protein [Flavobacteriaceae bacterium]